MKKALIFASAFFLCVSAHAARRFSITKCEVTDRAVSRIVHYEAACSQDNVIFIYRGIAETTEKLPTTKTKRKAFLNALISNDLQRDGASAQADRFYNGLKAAQQPKIESAFIGSSVSVP